MQKEAKFQIEEAIDVPDWAEEYSEDKFTVFKACFLSTKPNSHGYIISEEVLRKSASTILGNFLVARVEFGDATTHKESEVIYGFFPKEQKIEFVEADGVLKAYAYAVVSKRYSKEFNDIFEFDNIRNSSVEMTVETTDSDDSEVVSFDIYGLTCLNKRINGSCPDADIKMVRFSEKEASDFFKKNNNLSTLKEFAKERKQSMAVSYKVDKSKDAMSNKAWGDIDKISLRDKIMEASNKASLVKDVYMLVEDGYEDAPSEKLKYPVMCFEGDKLVYNRDALSTALGYAKKEGEDSVVNKIEKIYKKLNLDNEGKEEEAKMAKEIEFAAVDIGDMWGKIYEAIRKHDAWEYSIEGIYEEDNKKFAVLRARDGDLFRLDFSLTEEGLVVADEIVAVAKEFVEKDEIKKFAEPEDADKFKKFEDDESDDDKDDDEKPVEMSEDEMKAEMARLASEIENRDNIIMEKDSELETLRQFKADVDAKEKAGKVEGIMAEVKEWLSDEQIKGFREEGLACEMCDIDGWANKIKAVAFSAVKKPAKKNNSNADGIWGFAAPIAIEKKSNSLWD